MQLPLASSASSINIGANLESKRLAHQTHMERIQKIISQAGIASRRNAEVLIKTGRVFVNGVRAKIGEQADPEKDEIKVNGQIIKSESKIYIAMYKPVGYIVTKKDPYRRPIVFRLLPEDLYKKVWNIGRLDFKSEGLMLFTNDGELTNLLSHPSNEHEKEYEVLTDLTPTKEQLSALKEGIRIRGEEYKAKKIKADSNRIFITITEGRKHQVRRMIDAIGMPVLRLTRIRIGKLKLQDLNLKPGETKIISYSDIC